jgi:ATP-dependent DNA ligase
VKTGGKVMLYSRRGKSFNSQFRDVANALNYLPDDTVIDGEIVAIDEDVRPSFSLLQNFRLAGTNIQYFAFDILIQKGKELTRLPLSQRRQVLASVIKPDTYVEISEASDRPLSEMVKFVREHVSLRPDETSTVETLLKKTNPLTVMEQDFYPITSAAPKHINFSAQGALLECRLN